MDIKNKVASEASEKVKDLFGRVKLARESVEQDFTARKGINQTLNAHYAGFEVEDSTEAKGDFDIVINKVKPTTDDNVAVIMKGVAPNDRITFSFEALDSEDELAASQSEALVSKYLNEENKPSRYLMTALQNSTLFGAGFLHPTFSDEEESRIVSFTGSESEHKAFKAKAMQKGLTVKKLGNEKTAKEIEIIKEMDEGEKPTTQKYKLSKVHKKLRINEIDDDYFFADNYTTNIQDQQLIGYYDVKNIGEIAYKTGADADDLFKHGSRENAVNRTKLSEESDDILDNDENPFEKLASKRALQYVWYNDEKEGLVEICYSGDYIIYIKNVDFIPIVKICTNPYPNVLYGSSDARAAVPSQEYCTANARAALLYAWNATEQQYFISDSGNADPDALDEGDSTVFVTKDFELNKDLGLVPKHLGDLNGLQLANEMVEQNRMDVTGNLNNSDVINHEVMAPGNSGIKLQLGLSQTNILQERKIRCAGSGVKDLINMVWKTLVQNGNLPSVIENCKRVSSKVADAPNDQFLDYQRIVREYDWFDRQANSILLAIGMKSEENKIADMNFVLEIQSRFMTDIQGMVQGGIASPGVIEARRRLYLEALQDIFSRDDAEKILPSMEEIESLIQSHIEQESQPPEPTPDQILDMKEKETKIMGNEAKVMETESKTNLNNKKALHQEIETILTEAEGPKLKNNENSQLNINT